MSVNQIFPSVLLMSRKLKSSLSVILAPLSRWCFITTWRGTNVVAEPQVLLSDGVLPLLPDLVRQVLGNVLQVKFIPSPVLKAALNASGLVKTLDSNELLPLPR